MIVLEAEKPKATDNEECNGQIFRYRRSAFKTASGDIVFKDEFRFIKSKSCNNPNCRRCRWLYESAYESGGIDTIVCECHPKNGDLFELQITNVGRDWESGIVDSWDVELVRIGSAKEGRDE